MGVRYGSELWKSRPWLIAGKCGGWGLEHWVDGLIEVEFLNCELEASPFL